MKAKLDQLQKERVKGTTTDGWPTPIEEGKGPMKFALPHLVVAALIFLLLGNMLAANSAGPSV